MLYHFLMTQYKAKTANATLSFYDFVFTFGGGVLGEASTWTSTIKFSKALGSVTRPPQTWDITLTIYSADDVKSHAMDSLFGFLRQNMVPQVDVSEVVVETSEVAFDEMDDEDEMAPVIPLRMDLTDS